MLLVTYKDGHTENVEAPFKVSKEKMALIAKIERNPKDTFRKHIENEMQSFVHSMNHLSRNAVESPFTNISVFDRPKLKSLLDDDNLGWYYSLEPADELATVPEKAMKEASKLYNTEVSEENHEAWIDYVTDTILELEDIFMDVMDKGDVAHDNRPITFPVTTCWTKDTPVIINDKVINIGDALEDYDYGWTAVNGMYTRDSNGEEVAINRVFKGKSSSLLKIKLHQKGSQYMICTPDHLVVMEDGSKKKASELKLEDRLAYIDFDNTKDNFGKKTTLDATSLFSDPIIIGNKLSYKACAKLGVHDYDIANGNKRAYFRKSWLDRLSSEDYLEKTTEEMVTLPWGKIKGSIKRNINVDFDLGFLIGLFYAEGHCCKTNDIGFSFNENEDILQNFVVEQVKKLCPDLSIITRHFEERHGVQVSFNSATMEALIHAFIGGTDARSKYLKTDVIVQYNKTFAEGILLGIIAGDGSCTPYACSMTTVSSRGSSTVQMLASMLGISSRMEVSSNKRGFGSEDSVIQCVYFTKADMLYLVNTYRGHACTYKIQILDREDAKRVAKGVSPIVKGIESLDCDDIDVFNFEVDNDEHTYMLPNGIITSNCNISRGKDENGNYKFEDPDFVDHICKNHDIMRYNIYISEGNKVASCCMSYNTYFNFYDEKGNPVNMTLGDYVETRLGLEGDLKNFEGGKVFANRDANARLDGKETIRGMNGTIIPITGVSRLVNQFKKLIKITFVGGDVLWVTPNQEFVLRNGGKIEAKDLIAGSLLYKEVEVASVDTFDSDDYVYDIEVGSDDHLFKLKLPKCGKNVSVSNCRLINDSDLFELGGQVNSFGGTSLSLGSHRVATINLRRISLECDSFEDYKKRLTKRMEDAADILIAHRHLLKELVAKGTQPFIDNGWLDLDRMFSTFGIMGYYEAAKDMEKRFGGDVDYIGEIIAYIDSESRRISGERKNVFNVEEIPGETMSAKLANTDRWIYGEELVPEPMYTNQFVPLWEETTLSEKFKEEGRLTAKLTGGGICHYSLGEKLTAKQYRSVIEKALESGLEHFALNPSYSVDSNGHFTLGDYKVCPKCGAPITDHLSRTVGFFVFTSNMTKTKREEDFEKRHYKGI